MAGKTSSNNTGMMPPVSPVGMQLLFVYRCPHCSKFLHVPAPLQPNVLTCPACARNFPIQPVDESTVKFFHLMTGEGKALAAMEY